MAERDSLDKIITSYFATLTDQEFEWNGKVYGPRVLHVSPGIVRGFTCPAGCGGCCPRFSLDYIAKDGIPKGHPLKLRKVDFDGRKINVWSDMQLDHDSTKCRNLNWDDGRCGIHGFQPFSCDFELLRSLTFAEGNKSVMTQKLFGRGWAMMRVDGERGALCEMTPADPETVADVDRRLKRLTTWMTHFGLDPVRVSIIRSRLDEIAASGVGFVIDDTNTLL